MKPEPLFLAYLVYFNRDRDYFECHEVLEKLWLERGRDPLYKGLLQVAVGLYHFREGRVRGARMMLESAAARLAPYPPDSLGIGLGELVAETVSYAGKLARYDEQPFRYYDLTIRVDGPALKAAVTEAEREIEPNVPQRRGYRRDGESRRN